MHADDPARFSDFQPALTLLTTVVSVNNPELIPQIREDQNALGKDCYNRPKIISFVMGDYYSTLLRVQIKKGGIEGS